MADISESTNTKTKPTREATSKSVTRQSKKGLLWILVGVVLALIVVVGLVFLKPKSGKDDPKNSPTYSTSFFVYTNGSYTLWNNDGTRLTEDNYDSKSNFIGGFAYVKKGGEYAIIDENGKTRVPFGQISRIIDSYAGLFLIEDNDGGRHLITGDNRELLTGDGLEIDAPGSGSTFLVAELDEHYYVYNYAGRLVLDFAKANDDEIKYDTANDFALLYYNESNLLFDTRSGEQLAFFNGVRFEIDDISEDRSMVLLASDVDDEKLYKLVRGGNVYDLAEMQYYGLVRGTNIVVGYDDSHETVALLDDNYKVVKKVSSYLALKDVNNYATLSDGKIEITLGSNVVKSIDDSGVDLDSGVVYDANLYAIKINGKYGFYHLNGEFAFGEFEDVYGSFDERNHAVVSDDGKNYYMIDVNGKRLNDLSYTRIYKYDHSYLIYDSDGKRALLSGAGQPMTGFDYDEAYNRSVVVDHEVWSLRKEENKYDVFDAMSGKMILADVDVYDFYANYFVIKNSDDKKEFYTYNGYKFFTEE